MSLPPEFFASAWAGDDDPWQIADRWYERRKRDLVMAALPRERFGSVLEIGCASGHLSVLLAQRCEALLACDVNERAVQLAQSRLGQAVTVEQRQMPQQWPDHTFDLVVVSEVGYYLGAKDLDLLAERAASSLSEDGVLVACHWRHSAPGYPGDARSVHDRFAATALTPLAHHEEPDLLLDVWTAGEPSVARSEGWLA